jgi:hypothetical protein
LHSSSSQPSQIMALNIPSLNACIIPSLTERCLSHSALPEGQEFNCVSLEHDDTDSMSKENRELRSQIRTLTHELELKGHQTQQLNQLLQNQHLETQRVSRLLEVERAQSRISSQKIETLQCLLADHKVKYERLQDRYDHELARNMWIIDSDHEEDTPRSPESTPLRPEQITTPHDRKCSENMKIWEHKVDALRQQLDTMRSRNIKLQHRNCTLSEHIEELHGQRDCFKQKSIALELRVKERESVISEMQRIREEDTPQPPSRRAIVTPSFGPKGITINTFFPDDISCTETEISNQGHLTPMISPTYSMSTGFEYSMFAE